MRASGVDVGDEELEGISRLYWLNSACRYGGYSNRTAVYLCLSGVFMHILHARGARARCRNLLRLCSCLLSAPHGACVYTTQDVVQIYFKQLLFSCQFL
jgi:hypothetical protein